MAKSKKQKQEAAERARISGRIARYKELLRDEKPGEHGPSREMVELLLELGPILLARAETLEAYVCALRERIFWDGDEPDDADPEDVLNVEDLWADALDALGRSCEASDTRAAAGTDFAERKAKETEEEQRHVAILARKFKDFSTVVAHVSDLDVIAAAQEQRGTKAQIKTREEAIRALMWEPIPPLIFRFKPPLTLEILRLRLYFEPWDEYAAKNADKVTGKGRTTRMLADAVLAAHEGLDVALVAGFNPNSIPSQPRERARFLVDDARRMAMSVGLDKATFTGLAPEDVPAYEAAHPNARVFWDHMARP